MSKTIELLFDFVSPNAYLVWQPIKALAERQAANLEVTPVFLGGMHTLTGNAPPMIRDADVKGKNEYARLEMNRFIHKHGLDKWQMNPHFPFNSISLQRMLLSVSSDKRIDLIDALMPGIWEQQIDVSDTETIREILEKAGFDTESLFAGTQDPAIKDQLKTNTENAVARGAFGIPTFFIGEEMFFGKERLGQLEDELRSTS